jgi:hypothetical protein
MLIVVIDPRWLRVRTGLCAAALACGVGCGSVCGFGLRGRVTVQSAAGTPAPCCGGSTFSDVALRGDGDSEFDLSNVAFPAQPGLVDAYLVPTSCATLFDGPYPGAAPLCKVYTGPATPGHVASRVALPAGTYRVWLQAYTSNASTARYLVDVDIWNHSCRSPLVE